MYYGAGFINNMHISCTFCPMLEPLCSANVASSVQVQQEQPLFSVGEGTLLCSHVVQLSATV